MKIDGKVVVSVAYVLKNKEDVVLDESSEQEPFAFIHDSGMILQAFNKEFTGKQAGDTFKFDLSPTEGYGEFEEDRIQQLPKEIFGDQFETVQIGEELPMNTEDGFTVVGTVIGKDHNSATMDFNHALAGEHLFFEGTIIDVREASQEEIEEGVLDTEDHSH